MSLLSPAVETHNEIEAIVGGYHGDAFRILGPHALPDSKDGSPRWIVRAFLPHASSAECLLDGEAVYACLLLAVECEGRAITTIEGLAQGDELDPVQRAFVEADAYQCGFCTPGQVMSLRALLDETPEPSDEQIMRAVSGNLCRCGAYRHILEAGRIAAGRPSATVEASDADTTR